MIIDRTGIPFRKGDIVFSANFDYVPYVVEGIDQEQKLIFIRRLHRGRKIISCSKPRWFQIFKRSVNV